MKAKDKKAKEENEVLLLLNNFYPPFTGVKKFTYNIRDAAVFNHTLCIKRTHKLTNVIIRRMHERFQNF